MIHWPAPAKPRGEQPGQASDREWLVPLAAIVLVEMMLWCSAYLAGHAARPMMVTYGSIALAFFTLALCWKAGEILLRERPDQPAKRLMRAVSDNREPIAVAVIGSLLLALGSAALGSLKAGIPRLVPFWFDALLAQLQSAVLGDPAMAVATHLHWAVPFFDRLYATFVGIHMLAVLFLLASRPSREKSRALVAVALGWLVLGILGAYAFSSAGPIFVDRVYGGHEQAALVAMLQRDAPIATFTADALWAMHQRGVPAFGNGISAFPSMHVALTLWLALVLSRTRLAPLGWAYWALIALGSVVLGWHWVLDGVAGSLGMLAVWRITPRLLFRQAKQQETFAPAALIDA